MIKSKTYMSSYTELAKITYGSHLYGTSTPSSDFDFKIITLPAFKDLLLGKKLPVLRFKYDCNGNRISSDSAMPDRGYETENIPVQKFVHDYLNGQAYAVEIVFAVVKNCQNDAFTELCNTLSTKFIHGNLQGMTGFANKQVFDYIKRGERLNGVNKILNEINKIDLKLNAQGIKNIHLNTVININNLSNEIYTVLDVLASNALISIIELENNNKVSRALEVNGRAYSETTSLCHFKTAIQKLISSYGERSTKASESDVDWKSLSHAVRVYEQVLELLNSEKIAFPRPNADYLREIKLGIQSFAEVKTYLVELDDKVNTALLNTTLPKVDTAFIADTEDALFSWLKQFY
jgi:hypothetical protein